jgi:hypothetical protein
LRREKKETGKDAVGLISFTRVTQNELGLAEAGGSEAYSYPI